MNKDKPLKIARVVTVPFFLDSQLRQQMIYLLNKDFQVFAVSSAEGDWNRLKAVENLRCVELDIARKPSLIGDVKSLINLFKLFRKERFDIVHSATPKAGLLCAIAARLSGIPIRLHTFTGQPWATKQGLSRWLLRFFDQLIVWLNTQCYTDSQSQCDYLYHEGVGNPQSVKLLGNGSLAGVDLQRFNRNRWSDQDKVALRQELGLSEDDFVIAFVGRLAKEKGIFELISAFKALQPDYRQLHLLLIGPDDEPLIAQHLPHWRLLPHLHCIGHATMPEQYLAIANLLCLPSYREGFGTVVIEAAAMAIPTVGTKVTGLSDAIEDNKTGILVEAADAIALQHALESLITDKTLCEKLGNAAFERCCQTYDAAKVNELVANEYLKLANKPFRE